MCGCLGKNKDNNKKILNKNKVSCIGELQTLNDLNIKVLDMLKVERNSLLLEANKQIRLWIKNINRRCPNPQEYQIMIDYVNNEYTKYNT